MEFQAPLSHTMFSSWKLKNLLKATSSLTIPTTHDTHSPTKKLKWQGSGKEVAQKACLNNQDYHLMLLTFYSTASITRATNTKHHSTSSICSNKVVRIEILQTATGSQARYVSKKDRFRRKLWSLILTHIPNHKTPEGQTYGNYKPTGLIDDSKSDKNDDVIMLSGSVRASRECMLAIEALLQQNQ